MLHIIIFQPTRTAHDMALVLEQIASAIRDGQTSGHNPDWRLKGLEYKPNLSDDCDDNGLCQKCQIKAKYCSKCGGSICSDCIAHCVCDWVLSD